MLKLSRSLLLRRTHWSGELLPERLGGVKDASWLSNITSRLGFSTARSEFMNTGNNPRRMSAEFSIYKGKAALSATPVPPTFNNISAGFSRVEKNGKVLLKFMPAIGPRKYDSEKRQLFALSATEVGSLISLGPTESCEFFHDPAMKSNMEGKVKKTLTVCPLQDASGYFFNLNVLNSVQKTTERFSVPVTKAEFAVMRAAFSFALPHIMGWDRIVTPHSASNDMAGQAKGSGMRISPDLEWDR